MSTETASALLLAADADRMRSEATFAHVCDSAPVPASSGRVVRHRLNRDANRAQWRIAVARIRRGRRT